MAPRTFRFTDEMDKLCEAVKIIINYNEIMEIAPNDTKVIEFALKQSYDKAKATELSKNYMKGVKQLLKNKHASEKFILVFDDISDKLIDFSLKNMSLPHLEIFEIIKSTIPNNTYSNGMSFQDLKDCKKYAQSPDKKKFYNSYLENLILYTQSKGHEYDTLIKLFRELDDILSNHNVDECIELGKFVD